MSKKRKIAITALFFTVALTLCFIWGNSLLGKAASAQGSMTVYEVFAKPVLDFLFGEGVVSHEAFRKITHGAEFMLLGFEFCALFFAVKNNLGAVCCVKLLPCGFFVAFLDETLQIFSGRGPSVTDVWIDFGGYVFAAALSFAVYVAVCAVKKKKIEKIRRFNKKGF